VQGCAADCRRRLRRRGRAQTQIVELPAPVGLGLSLPGQEFVTGGDGGREIVGWRAGTPVAPVRRSAAIRRSAPRVAPEPRVRIQPAPVPIGRRRPVGPPPRRRLLLLLSLPGALQLPPPLLQQLPLPLQTSQLGVWRRLDAKQGGGVDLRGGGKKGAGAGWSGY
jgi:hypothetical protein